MEIDKINIETIIYVGLLVALSAILSGALWVWLDDVFGDL